MKEVVERATIRDFILEMVISGPGKKEMSGRGEEKEKEKERKKERKMMKRKRKKKNQ